MGQDRRNQNTNMEYIQLTFIMTVGFTSVKPDMGQNFRINASSGNPDESNVANEAASRALRRTLTA